MARVYPLSKFACNVIGTQAKEKAGKVIGNGRSCGSSPYNWIKIEFGSHLPNASWNRGF